MSKLTLSVDPVVAAKAKRFAKQHGVSVSGMVETYLATVTADKPSSKPKEDTPILRSLLGILKHGDEEDYRKYLVDKYR